MIRGDRFALQLLRIVIGFILAVIAAGIFLAFGFMPAGSGAGGLAETHPAAIISILGTAFVAATILGGVSAMPALMAILATELLGWRGLVVQVFIAGLLAFGLWTFGDVYPNAAAPTGLRPGTTVALAAGFVAGFVYWLVAGRCAGCWRIKETGNE